MGWRACVRSSSTLALLKRPKLSGDWEWKRGNKNEFTLALSLDASGAASWARVISWTKAEGLKNDVRDFALEYHPLDLVKLVDYMGEQASTRYEYRDFQEFSYLTVEPELWAILLTYVLTLVLNVGVSLWIIHNSFLNFDAQGRTPSGLPWP